MSRCCPKPLPEAASLEGLVRACGLKDWSLIRASPDKQAAWLRDQLKAQKEESANPWSHKARMRAIDVLDLLDRRARQIKRGKEPNCPRLTITDQSIQWMQLYKAGQIAGGGFGPLIFVTWEPWQSGGRCHEPVIFEDAMSTIQGEYNTQMTMGR